MKLKQFTADDAERVALLVGNESVSKWTSSIPFPYSKSDAVDWINQMGTTSERTAYAVELNDEIVACVSYWPSGETATEVGYWVGHDYWGRGICSRALAMLMNRNDFPKTPEIVAEVMLENIASQKVLEKCGFEYIRNCTIQKNDSDIHARVYTRKAAT